MASSRGGGYLSLRDDDEASATSSSATSLSAVSSPSASLFGDRCLELSSTASPASLMYSEDDVSHTGSQGARNSGKRLLFSSVCSQDGESISSSEESSIFADRYFHEPTSQPGPETGSSLQKESDSESTANSHLEEEEAEDRGRRLLRSPFNKAARQRRARSKTNLLKRAFRPFRSSRPKELDSVLLDSVKMAYSVPQDISDHRLSPSTQASSWSLGLDADELVDPEEPSDGISEISTTEMTGVEVWTLDDDDSSSSEKEETDKLADFLLSPLPESLMRPTTPAPKDIPSGLASRTPMEDIITKLQLGMEGWSAIQSLHEATAAAADAWDPYQCSETKTMPTLDVAGKEIPDYDSYVRQKINTFRRDVLKLSDDAFRSLQKHIELTRTI